MKIIHAGFIESGSPRRFDPPIGLCECGTEVELDDAMTNECPNCHALYNGSGQQLVDPSLWEEDDYPEDTPMFDEYYGG